MPRTKSGSRGPQVRLLAYLADGEAKKLKPAYSWIAAAIAPQIAVRAALRRAGSEATRQQMLVDPAHAVEVGHEVILKSVLHTARRSGLVRVEYPEAVVRYAKAAPWIDVRECVVQLTDAGRQHLLSGGGVWAKVSTEIRKAMMTRRVRLSVVVEEDGELHLHE